MSWTAEKINSFLNTHAVGGGLVVLRVKIHELPWKTIHFLTPHPMWGGLGRKGGKEPEQSRITSDIDWNLLRLLLVFCCEWSKVKLVACVFFWSLLRQSVHDFPLNYCSVFLFSTQLSNTVYSLSFIFNASILISSHRLYLQIHLTNLVVSILDNVTRLD